LRRRAQLNLGTLGQGIGRIQDYRTAFLLSVDDLEFRAEITPNLDVLQMNRKGVGVHNSDLRALRAKDECIAGNHQRRVTRRDIEVDLGEAARQKFAVGVGHVHFRQEGERRRVNGLGSSDRFASYFLVGRRSHFYRGRDSRDDLGAEILRDVDVNAKRFRLRDAEQFLGWCGCLKEDLDHANPVQRLRFGMLNVIYRRGQASFRGGDNSLLHLLWRKSGVIPKNADHRNVDVVKNVDRRPQNDDRTQNQDQERGDQKSIWPIEG